MKIRKYNCSDCYEITNLFYNTVHSVNAKDYLKEQHVERNGVLLTNFVMEKTK